MCSGTQCVAAGAMALATWRSPRDNLHQPRVHMHHPARNTSHPLPPPPSTHTSLHPPRQALDDDALEFIDTVSELPTRTEHFSGAELAGLVRYISYISYISSGAELAGLVRSAASFALGRAAVDSCDLAAGDSCAGAVVLREVSE